MVCMVGMVRWFLGSGALVVASIGGSSPQLAEPIKIACLASITGENKPWGLDQVEACKMAVSEVNKSGGINGRPIELIVVDTASRPDQAFLSTQKAIETGPIAIVGEVSSGNTMQIGKAALEKDIPIVACGATSPNLTDFANIFSVCYTDDDQGPTMAKFAFDNLKLRRVATLTDDALPYSQQLTAGFTRKYAKLGGQIVSKQTYESGGRDEPDYSRVLKGIKKQNVDGLYLSGYFTEAGPIAKRARALGIKAVFLGGDGWDSDFILTSSANKILGGYFTNHCSVDDPLPESRSFIKKWRGAHGGKPPATIAAALGYDAMNLTLDAIKRSDTIEPKAVSSALEKTIGFHGVTGDISLIGRKHFPAKRVVVVKITSKKQGHWQDFAAAFLPGDYR